MHNHRTQSSKRPSLQPFRFHPLQHNSASHPPCSSQYVIQGITFAYLYALSFYSLMPCCSVLSSHTTASSDNATFLFSPYIQTYIYIYIYTHTYIHILILDRYTVVGIATSYGMDVPRFEPRRGREFLYPSFPAPRPYTIRTGVILWW